MCHDDYASVTVIWDDRLHVDAIHLLVSFERQTEMSSNLASNGVEFLARLGKSYRIDTHDPLARFKIAIQLHPLSQLDVSGHRVHPFWEDFVAVISTRSG